MASAVGNQSGRWIEPSEAQKLGINLQVKVFLKGPKNSLEKIDAKAQEVLRAWVDVVNQSIFPEKAMAVILKLQQVSQKTGIKVDPNESMKA